MNKPSEDWGHTLQEKQVPPIHQPLQSWQSWSPRPLSPAPAKRIFQRASVISSPTVSHNGPALGVSQERVSESRGHQFSAAHSQNPKQFTAGNGPGFWKPNQRRSQRSHSVGARRGLALPPLGQGSWWAGRPAISLFPKLRLNFLLEPALPCTQHNFAGRVHQQSEWASSATPCTPDRPPKMWLPAKILWLMLWSVCVAQGKSKNERLFSFYLRLYYQALANSLLTEAIRMCSRKCGLFQPCDLVFEWLLTPKFKASMWLTGMAFWSFSVSVFHESLQKIFLELSLKIVVCVVISIVIFIKYDFLFCFQFSLKCSVSRY